MAKKKAERTPVRRVVSPPEKPVYDPALLKEMYQELCFYRRFEERVGLAYNKRKFAGFCHLHIGQEAVAVGVRHALRDDDYVLGSYRSHTQAIAKGIPPEQVMAELFGKVDGCSRGKGGSMHMFSAENRFYGGHGIVGGQVPIAAGIGFAIRYREGDQICVCFMGDAATNQGAFHEALNMAATWKLPVLYIIENNKYGMGTDISRTSSVDHLWKRALAFDMEHSCIDGMNVLSVYENCRKVAEDIRKEPRPHLMEILTYRYRGHSVSDPGTYRTKDEVKDYQENKDPIKLMGKYLVAEGVADEDQLKAWSDEAKEKAKEAEAFADASPQPDVSEAWEHVLAPST